MLCSSEAIIEPDGQVRLLEEVRLSGSRRALVTVLDEPADEASDISTVLLSEAALAEDWNRREEDTAWASRFVWAAQYMQDRSRCPGRIPQEQERELRIRAYERQLHFIRSTGNEPHWLPKLESDLERLAP